MQKRTKATSISPKVRQEVEARDSINGVPRCIFCGNPDCRGEAHFIRRSQGGLGIPQNLVTACRTCHAMFDEGKEKDTYRKIARDYLKSKYPDWNEEDLVYNKWKGFKYQ